MYIFLLSLHWFLRMIRVLVVIDAIAVIIQSLCLSRYCDLRI